MSLLDIATPWVIAIALLYAMRRLERWLREHVFKVGWLITKKPGTTTLLFYTFFLPGVFLHEFVLWLAAGILNVRAERSIKMPDEQQIAELKLNFIRIHRSAGEFRTAIISVAPLLVGLLVIGFVSQTVLNVPEALQALSGGGTENLNNAVQILTRTPDVWLWVYFVFTVANTMMPSWSALRGWRVVLTVLGVVGVILLVLGVADEVFFNALVEPLMTTANVLTLTFAFVIGVDLLATAVLGTIESIIERITGDSATFQNGKLIAITRKERLKQQEQERQRRERQAKAASKKAPSGPPSIYSFPLPIPDAPGKDAGISIRREEPATLESGIAETGSTRLPPPVINPPSPQKPLFKPTGDDDDKQPEESAVSATPGAIRPPPASSPLISRPAAIQPVDEEEEKSRPAASTLGASRPASTPSPLSRPAPAKPVDEEADEEDEDKPRPTASPFGARPTPSPFNRPTPVKPADEDNEDEEGESKPRPTASPFGARPTPSPFNRPDTAKQVDKNEEDEDDDKPPALSAITGKPAAPAKPALIQSDEDEEDEGDAEEEADDEEPSDEDEEEADRI